MKKIYMNPSLIVVKITARPLLNGSLDPTNQRGTVSEEYVVSGTAGESRRTNMWDDEEDDY